jgi:hypothetical protein
VSKKKQKQKKTEAKVKIVLSAVVIITALIQAINELIKTPATIFGG